MKRTTQFTAAVALLLLLGNSARAELVSWGYDWTASPGQVTAGSGKVTLSNEPHGSAQGNSNIVATNLKVFSTATAQTPDVFGPLDGKYILKLSLYDTDSGTSGTLTFSGQLHGSFSKSNANVTNTFDSLTPQTLALGNSLYSVYLTSFTPPGPPQQGNLGSIGAHVEVVADPRQAPEPSTLLLAGLGVGLAGLGRLRRKRTA